MSTIADLMIKIGADSSGLASELTKSKDAINQTFTGNPVKEFGNSVDEVSGKISGLASSFTKLAGIAAGGFGLNAVVQSAVNSGEAVYQLGLKYKMTAAEASQLNAIMRLTGGDVNVASSAIMRLDKTLSSSGEAGDKARSIMSQLGISMTDSSGRLKPLNEQLGELAKGYKQAQDAGQGQEFLMHTLGVRGMALTKTLLNYNDAAERASKIKGIGLNPEEMHRAYMDMQEVNLQFSKLGAVAGSALAPLVSELMPGVQSGLAQIATLIADNRKEISAVIIDGTKLLALYKSIQLVGKAYSFGKDVYDKAKNAMAISSGASSAAAEEKRLADLTRAQQRYINKSIADSDRMYQKRRRDVIKTAEQENMSAKETQAYLTEQFTIIGNEAAAAAEKIRVSMTEAFQQANVSAAEAAAGISGTNSEIIASNTQVSRSEVATGTAAQEAAAVKEEANAVKIASNEEVIGSNGLVSESEITTGTSAEEGAAVKGEANAAKIASNTEVIGSNTLVAESETAAGTAAEIAGGKSVAAKTAEKGAAAGVEGGVKNVAKAHVLSGNEAVKAGGKAVGTLGKVTGAAKAASGVLFAMAGGWMGVAAAALYAAYCAYQYFHAKYEAAESNTWVGDAGYGGSTYTVHDGRIWKQTDNGNADVAADPTGQGDVANGGVTETPVEEGTDEYAAVYSKLYEKGGSIAAYEDAKAAMDEANKKASDVNAGFDFNFDDDDDGKSKKSSSGRAASEKAETPMRIKYSFEDDGELATYANQIEYAANIHDIPATLLAAIIKTESHGNATAWSSDGAHYGLGQISQDIANQYNGGQGYGDGSDPSQNILAAAAYLSDLYHQYGDISQAISAYNAGHPTDSNTAYVNSVLSYMNAMTSTQVPVNGTGAQAQPVEYDVPVGELAAYHALNDYWDGQQWTGNLGSDASGWCDDFTHQVYSDVFKSLGKNNPFGSGVVNDQAFRNIGAYHEGDISAVRGALQPGDMVDTPGHVGIYIGNGMVRSRQSTAGVHDLSLDEFNATFGGIQGYGSLAEATGGMTVKSGLVGKLAVNQAAADAARQLAKAKADYAELLNSLAADTHKPDTAYETGMLQILDDIYKKRKKIADIDKVGGVDTSQAKQLLGEYKAQQIDALNKRIQQSQQQLADDTAKATAQMQGDYEAMYDAELQAAINKLEKEKEERFKSVAQHKDDMTAQLEVDKWYNAQSLLLTQKREEERRQEFSNSVKDAIQQLDVMRLSELVYSKRGQKDVYWEEKGKAMQEFYTLWRESSISTMGMANDAASSMASGLTSVFEGLGDSISNVEKLAQNMGKVILDTIFKIVAQMAASKITMGLLGGFLGVSAPTSGMFGSSWNYSSAYSAATSANSFGFTPNWTIPAFAAGGKVTAPTLGLIGEGPDDEAIYPLNTETYNQMARGIVAAQGNAGGNGNAPVVNIINNSNSQVSVKDSHYDNTMRRWILNAVVEDINNNVDGSATNLKAALGGR